MNVLVLGATGVVGDAVVREALTDDRVHAVLAVGRRQIAHTHPKLETVLLEDFTDFSPLGPRLADVGAVLCALGVSWYQAGGEAQYRRITHDYVLSCARVASIANPSMRFCFVSGHGASAASSQPWARIKAETEHDLEGIFGSRLTVFRPGYIHPIHGRAKPYWGDSVMQPFMPFRRWMRRWITDSREVARAVLHCAVGGSVPSPAENRAIIAAAAAYAATRPPTDRAASQKSARTSK